MSYDKTRETKKLLEVAEDWSVGIAEQYGSS